MRCSTLLVCGAALLLLQPALLRSQGSQPVLRSADADRDGLDDELEQSLLGEFAPVFMIGRRECSAIPAEFASGVSVPEVKAENGTIYGQVFPAKTSIPGEQTVELHYYHLWKRDCGSHRHPLDAEHVSVLVRTSGLNLSTTRWRALYWYAAAHEDTVCDVSQITRAATLKAEDHGATVWISHGKHASFLNQSRCNRGCGNDRCEEMKPLAVKQIVTLGEVAEPMNGSLWSSSPSWPLAVKMSGSDFPALTLERLETLPPTDIALFNSGRHPAQGIIAISNSTAGVLGTSRDNTFTAISVAGDSTDNVLERSYHKTVQAIGTSARHLGNALHPSRGPE
jgi:hypothetical protein